MQNRERSDRVRVERHKQAELNVHEPLMLSNADPVAPLPVLHLYATKYCNGLTDFVQPRALTLPKPGGRLYSLTAQFLTMATTQADVKSVKHDEPNRRPEVIVEFLFDRGLLFISVHNIGDRPALNVSVRFDQKIVGLGGSKEITELPLFRSLQFLGPQREIVTLVDSTASYFARRQPVEVTAHISYQDNRAGRYEETMRHNLEVFRELAYLDEPKETDNYSKAEVRHGAL